MKLLEGIVKIGIGVALGLMFTNTLNAQVNHVSFGGGGFGFPPAIVDGVVESEATRGFTGYLSIGVDYGNFKTVGGTIFIAGDSQIQYGGKNYGSGAVGLTVMTEIPLTRNGFLRLGANIGGVGIQTYERVNDIVNNTVRQGQKALPRLKKTNIQPFGAVKLSVGPVEFQYAPVNNMLTVGFRLYQG